MYVPGGYSRSELGDIELVPHDGALHLFHLVLPNHDRVAHLVSDDGLAWRRRPDAIRTGAPGRFDDDMIWTMGVVAHGDAFHMLYTALASAEQGRVQRIGYARSTDLTTWTVADSPAAEADAVLETDCVHAPWVSFRDPKPVRVDDRIVTAVCVRAADGTALRRGAVALYETDDPRRLGTLRSVFAPRRAFELECPQVFTVGGRWYLTASVQDDRSQRYWVADGLDGSWRTPPRDRLLPPGLYAARVFEHRGESCVLGWYRDGRGRGALLSPHTLRPRGDGTLALGRWPAWSARRGDPVALQRTESMGAASGVERRVIAEPSDAYELTMSVRSEAPRWSLELDGDAQGGALSVVFDKGEGRVSIHHERTEADDAGRPWFRHDVVQSAARMVADRVRVAVRRWADAIEVEVDDDVVLCGVAPRRPGVVRLAVESGTVTMHDGELAPLRAPQST